MTNYEAIEILKMYKESIDKIMVPHAIIDPVIEAFNMAIVALENQKIEQNERKITY